MKENLLIRFRKWELERLNKEHTILLDYKRDFEKTFENYKTEFDKIDDNELYEIFDVINITIHIFNYILLRRMNLAT